MHFLFVIPAQIGYWETFDGSAIREIEASVGSVNALDISLDGMFLVSGGEDRLVKVSTTWTLVARQALPIAVKDDVPFKPPRKVVSFSQVFSGSLGQVFSGSLGQVLSGSLGQVFSIAK